MKSDLDNDKDNDGLTDVEEQKYGTSISNPDSDYDGLLDGEEVKIHATNPIIADSDYDYIADSWEIFIYNTNPLKTDMDYDGLCDGLEIWKFKTDVRNPDTDGDFLNDYDEVRIYRTDAHNSDSDGDGISDGMEVHVYCTNPNSQDTDGDDLLDAWEIENNHNPIMRDNWDRIFGAYILVPGVGLFLLFLGIFASVELKSGNFGFKSIFEKRINIEAKQQQLLELLALVPKSGRLNINELAQHTGESKESLCELLAVVLGFENDLQSNVVTDNIVIHSHVGNRINFDITCFYCGEVININDEECSNCNEIIARCKVCNQPINYDENHATCASCSVLGEPNNISGFISVELICEPCLMKSRYNYI